MQANVEEIAAPLDIKGRPILVGDVLKVFHFIGARKKRHYMFKQVVGTRNLGTNNRQFLVISHLNMKDPQGPDGGYYLLQDGSQLEDTEIIQGLDNIEARTHLKESQDAK